MYLYSLALVVLTFLPLPQLSSLLATKSPFFPASGVAQKWEHRQMFMSPNQKGLTRERPQWRLPWGRVKGIYNSQKREYSLSLPKPVLGGLS